jgi:NTE family protein
MEFTKNVHPLNLATRMFYSLATQDYTADINILPRRRFWDPRKLLSVLSEDEVRFLIAEGEAATWPRIEMIRNTTRISRTLDAILDRMEYGQLYHHA